MLQNIIDETRFYIFYGLSSPSTYWQLTHSQSATEHFDVLIFINTLRNFFLVPVQVKTTITRYHPFINRPGRNSLGSWPSHVISMKSCRFSWPREFVNKVLMLFIEENCLSDSIVDWQKIKVEVQLSNYQKLHIIPSVKHEYS